MILGGGRKPGRSAGNANRPSDAVTLSVRRADVPESGNGNIFGRSEAPRQPRSSARTALRTAGEPSTWSFPSGSRTPCLRIPSQISKSTMHSEAYDASISASADELKSREAPHQTRALRTVSMLMNIRAGRDGSGRNPMPV